MPSYPRTLLGGLAFLLGAAALPAQATWNFTTGSGAASVPANLTAASGGGPAATVQLTYNNTSPSTAAYAGASGGNNASLRAGNGSLVLGSSNYAEFTLTPASGYRVSATGLTLGSRSDATGPTNLTLYSNVDNYAAPLSTTTVSANSTWASVTLPAFSVSGNSGAAVIFRLYASDGSGGAAAGNWRIDDVSLAATAVAAPLPTITAQPAPQTGSLGDTVSFSVTATGTGTLSYQWRKGSTAIAGNTTATTSTLVLTNLVATDAGTNYNVVVTDNNGSRTSSNATLTYNKITIPVSLTGLTATFDGNPKAVTATTTPAGRPVTITYDGDPTAPSNAGAYAVVAAVSAADPDYQGSANDTLTVNRAAANVWLAGLATTYNGAPRTPTTTTSPFGLPVTFTYDGGPVAPTNAGSYAVVATIAAPNYQGAAAGTFLIGRAAQTVSFPRPADRTIADSPVVLAATASSGLPVTYTVLSGGATVVGNTLVLDGTTGLVSVRASQAGGPNHLPATEVTQAFNVVAALAAPSFVLQPAKIGAFAGEAARFESSATGSPAPSYQWTRNGVAVPGATNAFLAFAAAAVTDSAIYQVTATNVAGTTLSEPVTLHVEKRSQTLTFDPPTTVLPALQSVSLTATASSGLPVTITLVSGLASLAGNTLTASSGDVVIRVSQPGNANFLAATTIERTLTFAAGGAAPSFPTGLSDATVNAGASVTFQATAAGTPSPALQWKRDGVALPGATTASLTLTAVAPADAGRYSLEATNSAGTTTTAANLVVRTAPVFTAQPAATTVSRGDPVTLTAAAQGVPAPSYQWRRNSAALPGATAATLTLASATPADAGRYDVVATNLVGSATSSAATVTVNERNFAGTYFGGTEATGDFALQVQADGSAVLLGFVPGRQTAIAVANVQVDPLGAFTITALTLATEGPGAAPQGGLPPTAAAPQTLTLRGTVDDRTGNASLTLVEFGLSLKGVRSSLPASPSPLAGYAPGAVVATASGRAFSLVDANGQAYVLVVNGTLADRVSGPVDANGRLRTTSALKAEADLTFSATAWSGALTPASGAALTLTGTKAQLLGGERLINVSVRADTAPGTGSLITGFVVAGNAPRQVLVRVVGPTLAGAPFQIAGTLADPSLQVYRDASVVASNNDWGTNGAAVAPAAAAVGAFPLRTGSTDAALVATLAPGAYSIVVGGGTGTVLAEVYEYPETAETAGARRLGNLSARGTVAAGKPLTTGFVIGGQGPQRVLLRAVGPTLAAAPFSVAGALANPVLTLYRGTSALRTNDDWFKDADAAAIRDAAVAVGAFALPPQSLDAALVVYLEPGAYTAQVTSAAASAQGVALVEVYEIR